MIVYLEVAIIDNLIINYILLFLSFKIQKLMIYKLKILLGSLIGTFFALVFPLIKTALFIIILLKIMLAFVMIYFSSKIKKINKVIVSTVIFTMLTFLLGGIIFAVFGALQIDIYNMVLLSYSSIFPVSIFVLLVFVFFKLIIKLTKFIYQNSKSGKLIFNIKLKINNKSIETQAFLDSGNTLKDDISNLPVCVISQKLFIKLYPNVNLINLILKKKFDLCDAHYIYYSTISNKNNVMLVFKPDEMKIFNGNSWIKNEALLGVSLKNFNNNKFEVLLNGLCEV